MRRPGDTTPAPPGGRVAARKRLYVDQRAPEETGTEPDEKRKRKKKKTSEKKTPRGRKATKTRKKTRTAR